MAQFPLTLRQVKKVWDGSQDPLDLLTPHEVKAAELYVSIAHNPKLDPGTLDTSKRVTFGRLFREHFGFELHPKVKASLFKNPAWLAYVQQLKERTKEAVLAKLEAGAMDAVEDYGWARKAAKADGDYKEVRQGAQDYLDRIGATRRQGIPNAPTGGITIILKSNNFEHAQVLKQLPPVEAELVEEEP